MKSLIRTGYVSGFLIIVFAGLIGDVRTVAAMEDIPPGPDRYISVSQEYMKYIWWLARWSDGVVVCQLDVDHEGLPRNDEVFSICGEEIHDQWITTRECEAYSTVPGDCSGFYLQLYRKELASRTIPVQLPAPIIWVTLDGCDPGASTQRCMISPTLVLTGEEPVGGHSIIKIEGTLDENPFSCGPICQVDLSPTDEDGRLIRFWAYSSYGDSSEIFTARVRVSKSSDPDDPFLYVDVITTQWRDAPQAPCLQTWNIFPPVGGLSGWLSSPDTSGELASSIPYEYLAGNLIRHGIVDTSGCSDFGLLDNGYASICGLEVARPAVAEWQNRFDYLIFTTSKEVGVPAQLLKNIFSRESQFWPGISPEHHEAGLGQLTRNGADTTLLWNRPFFEQFCPEVLDNSICLRGYPHLPADQRIELQDALVRGVDAFCPDCALGIDLGKAEASVSIFAETLLANCSQTRMVIDLNYNNKEFLPTYEDFWRFTLVNYNAGPGCLGLAVNTTSVSGEPLDWVHVSSHLTPACQGAIDYVQDITAGSP